MDTFAVIEDNVEVLIEIVDIGRKRVQRISESWERQKEVKNIMLFCKIIKYRHTMLIQKIEFPFIQTMNA